MPNPKVIWESETDYKWPLRVVDTGKVHKPTGKPDVRVELSYGDDGMGERQWTPISDMNHTQLTVMAHEELYTAIRGLVEMISALEKA